MERPPKTNEQITREQIEYCREDPNAYVHFLATNNPRRELVHMLYTDAVVTKKIKPLEVQTDEVKRFYWKMAQDEAKGKLTILPLKKLAKCLYFIENQL